MAFSNPALFFLILGEIGTYQVAWPGFVLEIPLPQASEAGITGPHLSGLAS